MSASLVGSEMCIRDRLSSGRAPAPWMPPKSAPGACWRRFWGVQGGGGSPCLLYTSDAADDM
eukprot:12182721-Alexandrium_andersonii.AAC.1